MNTNRTNYKKIQELYSKHLVDPINEQEKWEVELSKIFDKFSLYLKTSLKKIQNAKFKGSITDLWDVVEEVKEDAERTSDYIRKVMEKG